MDVEEEVILWVTSDLCTSMTNGATEVTMDGGAMSASSIPVTLISQAEDLQTLTTQSIDVIQFEEEEKIKTENKIEQNICIVAQPDDEKIRDVVPGAKDKKSRKRGVVWNYFEQTTQDRAKCTICAANISFKGKSTNNLLRHLRTKHKVSEETLKGVAGGINVCSDPLGLIESSEVDICPTTTAADGSTYFFLSTDNLPVPDPDLASNLTSDLTPNPTSDPKPNPTTDPASSQPASSTPVISSDEDVDEILQYKRRGGVWKYFKTNSRKRLAKCRECSALISYKGGSTTNLLRHMKSKHPSLKIPRKLDGNETRAELQYAYAEIVSECVKSDAEDETNTDGCNENRSTIRNGGISTATIIQSSKSDVEDCEIPTEMRERKKSAVSWKYFTMENEDHGRCNTCNILISFKGGSTGNLIRHLKTKHTELDLTPPPKEDIIESSESEDIYEEAAFDTIENNELAKFVQLLNPKYKFNSDVPLPFLNETKDAPKRLRKRGVAFSYFDAVSAEHYKCQKCDAIVNLRNGSKASLLRHLKSKHPYLAMLTATNDNNTDEATQNDGDGASSFDKNASINLENIENIPVDGSTLINDKMARKMRKRGLVWNYFAPLEDEKAKCITCPAVISYKHGSTSNLRRHMKKKHPRINICDEDYVSADELNADVNESNDEDANPPKRVKLSTDNETIPKRRIASHRILRKRGRVWNYFKPIAPDRAKCGLCNAIIIYLRGSTTNLWRHMRKKHLSIDLSKEKPTGKRVQYSPPRTRSSTNAANEEMVAASLAAAYSAVTDKTNSSDSPISSASTGKTSAIYRRSEVIFRKHFDKFLNRPVNVTKTRLFDDQLAKMIVKQYCPFTIVESEKFRKFIQQVNPGYSLPSRKTISSRLIPELYEKCAQQVRDKLHNVRYIMVGMNNWTLNGNEKYILMVAHYIDDESCTLQSSMLDCFRYDEQHTPEKLAAQIKTILSDWGLGEKLIVVVSDNAANVTAAIQLHSWRHIPCFANMLNAVVNNGLRFVDELCNKVDLIVEHFRKNQPAMKKLAAALVENGKADVADKVKSLKVEDPRNWRTIYDTFYQLLVCKTSLPDTNAFAESLPPSSTLTDYEWHLMERLCALLKPLLDVVREISEKNITISKVIPLSQGVSNYLKKTLLDEFLPKPLVSMIETMLNLIAVQFGNVEDNAILAEATFLDPRFKNHAFADQQYYANTYHSILQKAANLDLSSIGGAIGNCRSTRDAESNVTPLNDNENRGNDIWADFDLKVTHLNDIRNSESASVAELENYLMETLPKRSADPMVWWRDKRTVYPRLYEIVKQRLCIAATAVSTNLVNASQLVCEKRNKLSSCKISMVLFLNQNL